MSASIRASLVSLIVLLAATALLRADETDQMRKSFDAVTTALKGADGRTAKAYVIDEENNQKLVESLAKLEKSLKEFYKAAVAEFGKEGEDIGGAKIQAEHLPYLPDWAYLDDSKTAIQGDIATVPPKRRGVGLPATFKKEGGMWKLVVVADSKKAAQDALVTDNLANAYIELTGDTKRGKYHTPNDLQRAWRDKTWQAIQNSSHTR
jgi:hypothetical protein